METTKLKELILKKLDDSKILDIECIDVEKKTSLTRFVIVGTATSTKHADSTMENLRTLLKENGVVPKKSEGKGIGWLALDLLDIIVNLFTAEVRSEYNLENLWKNEL